MSHMFAVSGDEEAAVLRKAMRRSHTFEAMFLLTSESMKLQSGTTLGILPEARPRIMNTVYGANFQIRSMDTGCVTLDQALPPETPKGFSTCTFCPVKQTTYFQPEIDPQFMIDLWISDTLTALQAALISLATDIPDNTVHPGVFLFPPRVAATSIPTARTVDAVMGQLNARIRQIADTAVVWLQNLTSDPVPPLLPLSNEHPPTELAQQDKKGTKFVFHPLRQCAETGACRLTAKFAATATSLKNGTACVFSRGTVIITGIKSPEEMTHVQIEQARIIDSIRDRRGRRAFKCTRFMDCAYNRVQSGHFGHAVDLIKLRKHFTYNPDKHPSATSGQLHDRAAITVFTGGAYNVCGNVDNKTAMEIVEKTRAYFKEHGAIIRAKVPPSHRARMRQFTVTNLAGTAPPPS